MDFSDIPKYDEQLAILSMYIHGHNYIDTPDQALECDSYMLKPPDFVSHSWYLCHSSQLMVAHPMNRLELLNVK